MLIIDDYSRLTWVAFLKGKYEAFEKFKVFKALIENQKGKRLKVVRSVEEESLVQGTSNIFVINMGSKESILFQGLHGKME